MKKITNPKQQKDRLSPEAIEGIRQVINAIAPMKPADFNLLIPMLQENAVKKGHHLLEAGDVCQSVYFLTGGLMRMYYIDHEGNEINYRFTCKNNFLVDFQSLLTQKPSHFYWQAMEDSGVLVLPYTLIQKAYATAPAWNNFGRLIAEQVYLQLNERVEMLLFMTPEERYQHLQRTQPHLLEQVSQVHIASYLGIKPESLSRLRKRLMKKQRS